MYASIHQLGVLTANGATDVFDFDSSPGPASVTISAGATFDGVVVIYGQNGDATGDRFIELGASAAGADATVEINAPYQYIKAVGSGISAGTVTITVCWIRG